MWTILNEVTLQERFHSFLWMSDTISCRAGSPSDSDRLCNCRVQLLSSTKEQTFPLREGEFDTQNMRFGGIFL